VLQIIAESEIGTKVVFKGGTAIYHCYLDQYRFSEDLEFSSKTTEIAIEEAREIFIPISFLSIKKDSSSTASIKFERLQFTGPLQHPNILKVEIDRVQNILLPPLSIKYNNVWGMDFTVNVLDIKEIGAEKIRAMSDRARYRDFYDFYWITNKYNLDLPELVSYVEQKEIRKAITKANILRNWDVAGTQKASEMDQIFYSQNVEDKLIKNLIGSLPFSEITSTA
jgi:predicted nucleotidyltransferase component of viral defense system